MIMDNATQTDSHFSNMPIDEAVSVLSFMIVFPIGTRNFIDNGLADFGLAPTTIFHHEGEQAAQGFKINKITNCAPLPFIAHKTGIQQNREVYRRRILESVQLVCDLAS